MKEGENIEKLFKDGFENYEVDPGDHLWSEIEREIPVEPVVDFATTGAGSVASAGAGASWLTTVVVGGAIGLVSVAGYYYFENTAEARKEQNETEQLLKDQNAQDSQLPGSSAEESEGSKLTDGSSTKSGEDNASFERSKLSDGNDNSSSLSSPAKEQAVADNASESARSNQLGSNSATTTDADQANRSYNQGSGTSDKNTSNSSRKSASTNTDRSVDQGSVTSKSGSDLANNSDNSIGKRGSRSTKTSDSKANKESKASEKRTNSNKASTTNGNTVSIPSSNSVDETPGVIELYTAVDVLSPNGDGINDVFRIDTEKLNPDAVEVKVFNSIDGKLIHEWDEPYGYWDGMYKDGTEAQEGSYFYVITLIKDGKQIVKSGSFTLTRE